MSSPSRPHIHAKLHVVSSHSFAFRVAFLVQEAAYTAQDLVVSAGEPVEGQEASRFAH